MAHVVIGRGLTLAAGLLLLGPPLTVGAIGLGVTPSAAWIAPVVLAALAFRTGRVPALPLEQARRHPVVATLWVAALALAVTFSVRASLFAHYPDAPRFSVAPGDRFREEHLCMTAYAEAARLLKNAGTNVYDPELYRPGEVPRRIGPFTVDYYHYPPPFLLLPLTVRAVAPDFFDFRRVWFALQTTAVVALWLGVAWWVGGATGRRFALAGVGLMALPVTWASIQVGNVQSTMIAVALAGAMAVASGRAAPGAFLLTAATLGKIFPGVLLAHVIAWRRPRVAVWVAASVAGILAVTLALMGTGIFHEFAFGELPRMLAGESFPQTEAPWAAPMNQSIYGFTVKLRRLGIDVLDRATGKLVTRVLVMLLGAAVLLVGWRVGLHVETACEDSRLATLLVVFGFVNLASFLSPFVGGAYGALYTIWLGMVVSVSRMPSATRAWFFGATALLIVANALVGSPRQGVIPSTATMAWSLTAALMLLAINVGAVWAGAGRLSRAAPGTSSLAP